MTPTAADCMSHHVIPAHPDMSLEELAGLFAENGIHGAPVIDARGHPVGVVTVTDLLRRMRREAQPTGEEPGGWYRHIDYAELMPPHSAWITEMPDDRVADIMNRKVISVGADEALPGVARTMVESEVHRVLVTRGHRVVGILSSMDVVRAVAEHWPKR